VSRFWDDLSLVAPEAYVPNTVQTLLDHLGLEDAPRADQESGIRDWLTTHPPGPSMVYTLQRKGFGHLIDC